MTVSMLHKSLAEYVSSERFGDGVEDGLAAVIQAIAEGGRRIQEQVALACLADMCGATGDVNFAGDAVQRLDAASTEIFVEVLEACGRVAILGCEEIEQPVVMGTSPQHEYIVLMDPLDGSSNIDVAVSIGSIFGIWKRKPGVAVNGDSLLRPGREQVAALYVIYGSCTALVLATDKGVQGFTLHPPIGAFRLTHPDLKYPTKAPYYSVNDANWDRWEEGTRKAVLALREGRSQRYIGSLVADFHRNLLKGGLFMYPGDKKNPLGKLRLTYEANPLGYVAVKAGGAVSTGKEPILDMMPASLHQKTPLVVGNKDLVEQTVAFNKGTKG